MRITEYRIWWRIYLETAHLERACVQKSGNIRERHLQAPLIRRNGLVQSTKGSWEYILTHQGQYHWSQKLQIASMGYPCKTGDGWEAQGRRRTKNDEPNKVNVASQSHGQHKSDMETTRTTDRNAAEYFVHQSVSITNQKDGLDHLRWWNRYATARRSESSSEHIIWKSIYSWFAGQKPNADKQKNEKPCTDNWGYKQLVREQQLHGHVKTLCACKSLSVHVKYHNWFKTQRNYHEKKK